LKTRRKRERGLFGQAILDAGDQQLVKTARSALKLGRTHLADYAHVYAPKMFTAPQLFACLILKAITGVMYRRRSGARTVR
jgi:hypothetical protein